MPATTASSLIDVLDSSGQPVGTATREEALAAGLPVRTVHIFLFDSEGRLLLQQLAGQRDRHPLLWGSSVAAFPRPGEPEDAAARRRLAEELGLQVVLRRVGTIQTRDGRSLKFVTLYEGSARAPRNLEPDQIARLEFRSVGEIDAALNQAPAQFTETFRQVYTWWRERHEP